MARTKTNRKGIRKARFEKKDRYEAITAQIVKALEDGAVPWHRPWDAGVGMPHNGASGHCYSGINLWLTWASGHMDPRWFTFNQTKKFGTAHVRKGEKGTMIFKWLFLKKTVKEDDTDGNEVERNRTVPILKTFTVFNYAQIEWDSDHMPKGVELKDIDPEAACVEAASLVAKTGAKIKHGGGRAFYRPSDDFIGMPEPGAFEDANAYWATMLHEVTHWTGHGSRCARNLGNRFGSEAYAAEELVAEMGSAFLCTDLGVAGKLQHAGYVADWIKVLKNDKYALFTAARLAREAVTFAKGEKATKTETADPTAIETAEAKAA